MDQIPNDLRYSQVQLHSPALWAPSYQICGSKSFSSNRRCPQLHLWLIIHIFHLCLQCYHQSLKVHGDKVLFHFSTSPVSDELPTDKKDRRGEAARPSYPQFLKVHEIVVCLTLSIMLVSDNCQLIKKNIGEVQAARASYTGLGTTISHCHSHYYISKRPRPIKEVNCRLSN